MHRWTPSLRSAPSHCWRWMRWSDTCSTKSTRSSSWTTPFFSSPATMGEYVLVHLQDTWWKFQCENLWVSFHYSLWGTNQIEIKSTNPEMSLTHCACTLMSREWRVMIRRFDSERLKIIQWINRIIITMLLTLQISDTGSFGLKTIGLLPLNQTYIAVILSNVFVARTFYECLGSLRYPLHIYMMMSFSVHVHLSIILIVGSYRVHTCT